MNVNVSLIPEGNFAPTEIVPWKPVASILFLNLPLNSNASHTDRKSSVTANVGLLVLVDIKEVLPLLGKFPGRLQVSISPCIFHRPFTPMHFEWVKNCFDKMSFSWKGFVFTHCVTQESRKCYTARNHFGTVLCANTQITRQHPSEWRKAQNGGKKMLWERDSSSNGTRKTNR